VLRYGFRGINAPVFLKKGTLDFMKLPKLPKFKSAVEAGATFKKLLAQTRTIVKGMTEKRLELFLKNVCRRQDGLGID